MVRVKTAVYDTHNHALAGINAGQRSLTDLHFVEAEPLAACIVAYRRCKRIGSKLFGERCCDYALDGGKTLGVGNRSLDDNNVTGSKRNFGAGSRDTVDSSVIANPHQYGHRSPQGILY